MSLFELFLIAVGLSMDAFAVSICMGLSLPKVSFRNSAIVGLYFGAFQAGMPLAGYFIGTQFADSITAYDHWVAFILLGIIGGKMIKDSFSKDEDSADAVVSLGPSKMIPLAVATSIDALAVGVSLAFLNVQIAPAVSFIGVTTFGLSMLGVKIGNVFGLRYKSRAELAGGIILALMGTKILAEHLGIIDLICNMLDNTVK